VLIAVAGLVAAGAVLAGLAGLLIVSGYFIMMKIADIEV